MATPVGRPDFGEVSCPDCDVIMKPITLADQKGQSARAFECPKCGRRLQSATSTKP
jgi:uncharacterized paraquat-inducible protein A